MNSYEIVYWCTCTKSTMLIFLCNLLFLLILIWLSYYYCDLNNIDYFLTRVASYLKSEFSYGTLSLYSSSSSLDYGSESESEFEFEFELLDWEFLDDWLADFLS